MGEALWASPLFWEGNLGDPNRMPSEMAVTYAMSDFVHSISLRAAPHQSHIDSEALSFRMYVEWAGSGDLAQLIRRHIGVPAVPVALPRIPEPVSDHALV